jgi:uncharacterized protein (DUF1330 family)
MQAYAVAHLRTVVIGPDIVAYLEQIDATLAPFGGQFVIHGGSVRVLEGTWSGDLVVIAFPDRASAEAWYASPAYQAILPLRTKNAVGDAFIIDGVEPGHRAGDVLAPAAPRAASQSSKSPAVSFSLPSRSSAMSALPSPSMSPYTTVLLPSIW